jgi:hypothetical protein
MAGEGTMKTIVLFLSIFFIINPMQQYQHRHQRRHSAPARITFEPVNEVRLTIVEQVRRSSEERERQRYRHKMKITLVSLGTSALGGLTALIVYLTK